MGAVEVEHEKVLAVFRADLLARKGGPIVCNPNGWSRGDPRHLLDGDEANEAHGTAAL